MTDLVESECSISIPGVKRNEPVPKFTMEWRKKRSRDVRQMQHSVCKNNCQICVCSQEDDHQQEKHQEWKHLVPKRNQGFRKKPGEFVVPTTYFPSRCKFCTKSRNYQSVQL